MGKAAMVSKRPSKEHVYANTQVELTMDVASAREKLARRIELGKALLPELRVVHVRPPEGDDGPTKFRKWHEYNVKLIEQLFTTNRFSIEYSNLGPWPMRMNAPTAQQISEDLVKRMTRGIANLEHVDELLDLYAPAVAQDDVRNSRAFPGTSSSVFVVHGHDGEAKQAVARCIEKLGLDAVILHERPNGGKTLIEKFEEYADVGFAVILLTADDQGGTAGAEAQHPRARQNVVFEMGYFCGKLTRSRVCALYEAGVELPSDLQGIVYTPLDDGGAWRFSLAQELTNAGYAVDANKLLSRL